MVEAVTVRRAHTVTASCPGAHIVLQGLQPRCVALRPGHMGLPPGRAGKQPLANAQRGCARRAWTVPNVAKLAESELFGAWTLTVACSEKV